jgi:hypothetical protein
VTGGAPSAGSWDAWLAALAAAATEFERRLDAGEPVAFVDLRPPAPGPLPDALLDPARALLDRLGALGRRAEEHQDALRDRLAGLAVPRPRGTPAPDHEIGARVDIAG